MVLLFSSLVLTMRKQVLYFDKYGGTLLFIKQPSIIPKNGMKILTMFLVDNIFTLNTKSSLSGCNKFQLNLLSQLLRRRIYILGDRCVCLKNESYIYCIYYIYTFNSLRPVFVQRLFVQDIFVKSISSNPIRLGQDWTKIFGRKDVGRK